MKKRMMALLLAVALLTLNGCGMIDGLRLFKSELSEESGSSETTLELPLQTGQNDASEAALFAASAVAAGNEAADAVGSEGAALTSSDGETTTVLLYFLNEAGSGLEAETREIGKQEGLARATITELLQGPQADDLSAVLPTGTQLRDINIRDGVCTVDLSGGLLSSEADTRTQLFALYSVVNTLTQFESVDFVRLLVEGRSLSAPFGGVDASAALAPLDKW